MHKFKYQTISIILVMVLSLASLAINASARPLAAPTRVDLGTADSFTVLAGTAITDVPSSVITGNVGLSPAAGTNYAGLTTAEVSGTIYAVDATGPGGVAGNNAPLVNSAKSALTTAYTNAANEIPATPLAGLDNQLGGKILIPGIYSFGHATTANLTAANPLTLNAQGDPNAVFIFQLSSDLITASSSVVQLSNGAQACNVFWQVTSSATLGTDSTFVGTVMALTSITDNGRATVQGRLLARNGQVALNQTHITRPLCAPTIATTLSSISVPVGSAVHDSAILSGATSNAGGSVTYSVYTNDTCTSNVQSAGTKPVTNGVVPDSNPITFNSVGTYYWQVVYSGDSDNNGATSTCTSEALTVIALTPTPTRTLPPTPTRTSPVPTNTPIAGVLPGTGFSPRGVTVLSAQPAEKAYADLGDLWLEIPRLGVQMPIVGIPQTAGEWDVSWLGSQAGWLNGSAYPTWAGNSVLTGHVWNADNTAGPFRYINTLWWGDKVIIHAGGAQYVYEVRSVQQVRPNDTAAMMKHQTLPWVTLVTCRGYDQASNSYKYRVLVRAVLVGVK